MNYTTMPVIIPVMAAGYLLTIYLLLTLAQRTIKNSPYVNSSLTDTYTLHGSSNETPQTEEGEGWQLQMNGTTTKAPDELHNSVRTNPKVQGASVIT